MTIEFSERDLGKHGIPYHVEIETVQGKTFDIPRLQQATLLADRDIAGSAVDNHGLVGRRVTHQARIARSARAPAPPSGSIRSTRISCTALPSAILVVAGLIEFATVIDATPPVRSPGGGVDIHMTVEGLFGQTPAHLGRGRKS